MHYSANDCHYCFKKSTATNPLFIAKCCKSRCNKSYCINCINSHFDKEFVFERYKKDTWICYSCQDKCNCQNCGGIDKVTMDRKNSKKKSKSSQIYNNKNQESADVSVNNSVRLQSQFILKNDIDSSDNQGIFASKQQQIQIEQKKQPEVYPQLQKKKSSIKATKIAKKDKAKQFLQQKTVYPPYLQKILDRKKLFYTFIQTKTKKPLQQLFNMGPDEIIQEEEQKPILTRRSTQKQITKQKIIVQSSKRQKPPTLIKIEERSQKVIDAKKLKQIINNQMKEYDISDDNDIELLEQE